MTADQAAAVAATVGPQIAREWQTTVRVIAAVPEAQREWRPAPGSRSAWELAVHICRSDLWFLNGILANNFAPGPKTPPAPTVAGLVEWYRRELPAALERTLALDSLTLAAIVDFYGLQMPAVQLLLWQVVHHAHHRGQLSSYLRPMGARVPSICGDSLDEPWRRT